MPAYNDLYRKILIVKLFLSNASGARRLLPGNVVVVLVEFALAQFCAFTLVNIMIAL